MKHLRAVTSIIVMCLAFFVSTTRAQQTEPTSSRDKSFAQSAIFLELGGNALVYSVNIDRMIDDNKGFRIGIGYMGLSAGTVNSDGTAEDDVSASMLLVPAMFNFFVGSQDKYNHLGSSKLELGIGAILVSANGKFGSTSFSGTGVGGTATIGYRYQPYDGGFVFRIGFTPVFAASTFFPWAGISFGLAF